MQQKTITLSGTTARKKTSSGSGKRYKKKAVPKWARRIIASWLVCLVIGGLIGGIISAAIINASAERDTPTPSEHGTRDGRVMEAEMSMDWGGDLEFTPIACGLPEELQEFTFYLSKGYYIDFSFVLALMDCESGFRTDVISGTDDYGLLQINKCNHEWLSEQLGITDFTDPYQNIRAGLYMLRKLFEKYDTPEKVLMAYNMGEYGASQLWERGVYETAYSKKVLEKADEYNALIENSIKK